MKINLPEKVMLNLYCQVVPPTKIKKINILCMRIMVSLSSVMLKIVTLVTVKPPINTPKEDKPSKRGQAGITLVYTLYRKSPLKENNHSREDTMAGPESVLIKRFHCISLLKELHAFSL